MPSSLIVLIGLYGIIDALSLGLGEEQRYFYAVLVLSIACILTVAPKRFVGSPLAQGIPKVWLATTTVGLIMVAFQPDKHVGYVIGDAVSFTLPLLMLVFVTRSPGALLSDSSLSWLGIFMVLAAGLAFISPMLLGNSSSRFREPPVLLVSWSWVILTNCRANSTTALACVLSALVAALTLLSGARFALVIWLAIGSVIIGLGISSKVTRQLCFGGSVLIAICLLTGIADEGIVRPMSDYRISSLIENFDSESIFASVIADGSMENRILEADDALHTRRTEHNLVQWLVGSGHGATFNTGCAYYGERALGDGTAHHIHFGLVLLYYRYGLLGLALYFLIAFSAVRSLLAVRRVSATDPLFKTTLVFDLASLGYLANLLLFNQLVDPTASFAFAGQLATSYVWKRRASNQSNVRISDSGCRGTKLSSAMPANRYVSFSSKCQ